MRCFKLILFLLSLLLSSGNIYSQWLQQNSGINTTFDDIEFLNKNTGWIVGDGTILKTTNGGDNWIIQQNPASSYPLINIHIVDSNVAYIAGWFELVLKTTNGGMNWNIMRAAPVGQGNSYSALYFINQNTGWFAGAGGINLKTTNGGKTFDEIPISNSPQIHDMYFKDENTGLMTGGALSNYKTTNGGANWNFVQMPVGSFGPEFIKLAIVNNQIGWVIAYGDAQVFKTTDFGDTWNCIDTIATGSLQTRMYSITFVDENTGFAGGTMGKLYKTTDGGFNWIRENSGYFPPAFIGAIELINIPENPMNPTGWATGGAGKIIKTTNGGETYVGIWSNESEIPTGYVLSQNYPNPFNPATNINYTISERGFVSIKVYDISGKQVSVLVNELRSSGNYSVNFDAAKLTSGIYFYRMRVNDFQETKKMVLLK